MGGLVFARGVKCLPSAFLEILREGMAVTVRL